MKSFKTLLALLLALVMVFALAACGAKDEVKEPDKDPVENNKPADDDKPADEGNGEESYGTYTIGYNNLGTGVWILDKHQAQATHYLEYLGCTVNAASANFSSDQMLKDIQNQLNAGEDGHIYFGCFGTLTPAVNDLFEDAGVYWSNADQQVSVDLLDTVRANPYFVGSVGAEASSVAIKLAELAYELGYRKALQMAGAVGDTVHDMRMDSFEKAFTDLGGEVIAIARCTDPSEAAAKADDLFAAYADEADCFYCLNMDFALGAYNSMSNYGLTTDDIMLFSSEPDAWGIEMIKNGQMYSDTYVSQDFAFASALLINALDGHPILDENGEAPYTDKLGTWIVTEERADFYQEHFVDGFPVTFDDFDTLLYRNNPDVDFAYFEQMLVNYGDYDYTAAAWGE